MIGLVCQLVQLPTSSSVIRHFLLYTLLHAQTLSGESPSRGWFSPDSERIS